MSVVNRPPPPPPPLQVKAKVHLQHEVQELQEFRALYLEIKRVLTRCQNDYQMEVSVRVRARVCVCLCGRVCPCTCLCLGVVFCGQSLDDAFYWIPRTRLLPVFYLHPYLVLACMCVFVCVPQVEHESVSLLSPHKGNSGRGGKETRKKVHGIHIFPPRNGSAHPPACYLTERRLEMPCPVVTVGRRSPAEQTLCETTEPATLASSLSRLPALACSRARVCVCGCVGVCACVFVCGG